MIESWLVENIVQFLSILAGDVILSINGQDMEKVDHKSLVRYIKSCDKSMRMVVLFENCVHKVELHMKFLKLRKVLQHKLIEFEQLCDQEDHFLAGNSHKLLRIYRLGMKRAES